MTAQTSAGTTATAAPAEFQLYGVSLSGHCHRVELMLRLLDLPYRTIDAQAALRNTPEFLRLNPLGQIPVLQQGDLALADSNAILVYLTKQYAPGSHWLPEEPVAAAHVQRWLSIAAGEIMHGPGTARLIALGFIEGEPAPALKIAARLLPFMETHLAGRQWLATNEATIADVACYAYIAHAPEGGISLAPYPSIKAWLQRVEALPRFKGMPASPLPAAA
ncbi:MAG TPA: glutathione S-transferase [Herbaspirillum sp.]|jgi:glutathione S-transferase